MMVTSGPRAGHPVRRLRSAAAIDEVNPGFGQRFVIRLDHANGCPAERDGAFLIAREAPASSEGEAGIRSRVGLPLSNKNASSTIGTAVRKFAKVRGKRACNFASGTS